jgi:uncharacterized protein (TIGR03083 family)
MTQEGARRVHVASTPPRHGSPMTERHHPSRSSGPEPEYDVVVVGARCAGSPTAAVLAGAGLRVLVVDRDGLPSDTVSTHQLFPDSLALLDRLGALPRLRRQHQVRATRYSWRILGHAVAGTFTPVGGHDRTMSVRRVTLDAVLQDTAVTAGAELRDRTGVVGLLGSGTTADPVHGVVLSDGTEVHARWVVGADGRTSTVARRLGLERQDELRGDLSMLFAYWTGMPDSDWCRIDVQRGYALMSSPCEDDVHLLVVSGPAGLTRGTADDRQTAYLEALHRFPAVLNPRLLELASQASDVVSVPETMLRGFRRHAAGPGWVLVGDAGLYKHPATGQGISDALVQGRYVADELAAGRNLGDYGRWRDARSAGHYEFSFAAGTLQSSGAAALYSGLAADPGASQEFLDVFTKRRAPHDVMTADRLTRWRTAWTYEQGLVELAQVLDGTSDDAVDLPVPACPDWTVGDLLAHLVGAAADAAAGEFYAGAMRAWHEPDAATARELWTAGHVRRYARRSLELLRHDLETHGARLAAALRRGDAPVAGAPDWGPSAPVGDLCVHLDDLREALGLEPATSSPVTRWGFASYRTWLHLRLRQLGLPALVLHDGTREWPVGVGPPAGTVTADQHELFRMIAGRRSADRIRAYDWTTDPEPYLAVIAPYPLPT